MPSLDCQLLPQPSSIRPRKKTQMPSSHAELWRKSWCPNQWPSPSPVSHQIQLNAFTALAWLRSSTHWHSVSWIWASKRIISDIWKTLFKWWFYLAKCGHKTETNLNVIKQMLDLFSSMRQTSPWIQTSKVSGDRYPSYISDYISSSCYSQQLSYLRWWHKCVILLTFIPKTLKSAGNLFRRKFEVWLKASLDSPTENITANSLAEPCDC